MNSEKMPNFNKFTKAAVNAAESGGRILLKYFKRNINVNYKGRIDPVTIADTESQKKIFEILYKEFPGHGFMGEEQKYHRCSPDYCWIVDPLDGTVNFIHGYELFCVSIGLQHKNEIISGVIHCPALGETYVAEKGKGAWLNGKKIKVSNQKDMVHSLVVTGFPYEQTRLQRVISNFRTVLSNAQGVRRLGSAAIDLAYVASGRFEAFWEEGLNPWDVAAGGLLVKEAGGKVTDYKGGRDFIFKKYLLASNGHLHAKILKLLK